LVRKITADRDYTLAAQITQVADMLVKVRERELLRQKLSATAASILFLVNAMGNEVTPAKISRMMLREPHTIGGILSRMEKSGLINRTKNLERKNRIRITLTEKGEKALKKAMQMQGTAHLLCKLTDAQREQLQTALKAIKQAGIKELRLSPKALQWP